MTDASNNQSRARSFERHTKELLSELVLIGTNVSDCRGFHGWVDEQHPQSDRTEGLDELAAAIENFAKSLRFLLSGNRFWISETVTDRAGVRDLKEFKPDVEAWEPRLAAIMDSQDQSNTLKELRKLTSDVEKMAQKFKELRENMLVRILDKASHANDKNEETEPLPHLSPAPPSKEKEEAASETDPYSKRRYVWLFFGLLIFHDAILTHVLHILLFAILLHTLPAIQIYKASLISQNTTLHHLWRKRMEYCPFLSWIDISSPETTKNRPKNGLPTSLADALENAPTANSETRTEEHITAADGPGLRFTAPNGIAPDIPPT